jgi:transposase InsO family protein
VAENVLDRQFEAQAPDQRWVADITYISTREGWLYLAAVVDLYSRMVVGWSMANHMESRLVVDALEMAVARRVPGEGYGHTATAAVSTPVAITNNSSPSMASRAA